MSGWPLTQAAPVVDRYDTTASDYYSTTVTADSTAHTKGSWTELDASTSIDAYMLGIHVDGTAVATQNTGQLLDIGIGAAASETVLIPNILTGWQNNASNNIPVYVPAGTRLSARLQAQTGSDTADVGLRLVGVPSTFNGDPRQYGNVVTYGADTANSRGTVVAGSGTAHTKGSWTQITASTTNPISALGVSIAGHTDTTLSSQTLLLEIGVGAASSEAVILSDVIGSQSSGETQQLADFDLPVLLHLGRTIPTGSRLAARVQYSTTGNDDVSICIHGVT